jgi:hypothetical protein
MNRSYSKIRHIQEANSRLEKRFLSEGGDDPIQASTTTAPSVLSSPEKKQEIKSFLWSHLNKPEHSDLKHSLGIDKSHTEHNFLDDISHKIHVHLEPSSKHMNFEFPGLGSKHNAKLNFGFSLPHKSDDNHGSDHTPTSLTSLIPHSNFNVGVKIPLSSIFGK